MALCKASPARAPSPGCETAQNQPTGSLNLSVVRKLPRSLLEHCKAFLPESRHLRIRKSQTPQIRFCFFRAKRPGIVDKFFRGRRKNLIAGLEILRRIAKNQVIGRRPVADILELLFWHVAGHATVGRRSGLSTRERCPAGLDLMASEASLAEVLCRLRFPIGSRKRAHHEKV